MDDDDVTTATAETDAVNNITNKIINPNNSSNNNRPPRLFMASITEEQSRRSLFNDYSSRSGKSLTAGSGGGQAAGGNNNSKSNRNIVGTNVQWQSRQNVVNVDYPQRHVGEVESVVYTHVAWNEDIIVVEVGLLVDNNKVVDRSIIVVAVVNKINKRLILHMASTIMMTQSK